jgi:DNA-3-methyladenine glycosylase II
MKQRRQGREGRPRIVVRGRLAAQVRETRTLPVPWTIESEADIAEGIAALSRVEPRLARLYEVTGPPPLRRAAGGAAGLLRIVMDQQISLLAGAAIWRRLEARFAPFEAAVLASAREEDLRACGLSGAKIRTLRAVGEAMATGRLDFQTLAGLSDEDAAALLTTVPGIGPWTADIFLLTCLGRRDVWPAGDLALRTATGLAFELEDRPSAKNLAALAEPWRPWRAVAARLLWSYYRHVKGMSQTVA